MPFSCQSFSSSGRTSRRIGPRRSRWNVTPSIEPRTSGGAGADGGLGGSGLTARCLAVHALLAQLHAAIASLGASVAKTLQQVAAAAARLRHCSLLVRLGS